jgi:hypothetical protein
MPADICQSRASEGKGQGQGMVSTAAPEGMPDTAADEK